MGRTGGINDNWRSDSPYQGFRRFGGGGSSGGGVLVAAVTWNEDGTAATLSATYNQLLAAQLCVARDESSGEDYYERNDMPLISLYEEEGNYGAFFYNYFSKRSTEFIANSPDGVMTHSENSSHSD